ncbi:MAG: prephenate dehydrogenase [Bacteroidota bacterium]
MKVAIIGLGHIGSSIAQGLRKRGVAEYVVGVDRNVEHQEKALEVGTVDEVLELRAAIEKSDVIVLSIPVDATKELLPTILDLLTDGQLVIDVGSTKQKICEAVHSHPNRRKYVSTHPIAGTEKFGPEAGIADLFNDKKVVICEQDLSGPEAVRKVVSLYKVLGAELVYMNPVEHDMHLAYISHLSHITSFSLALSVLEAEKDEKQIFQFSGSGFASTARLAKSSPEMWSPVFLENKEPILSVLDQYIEKLEAFRNNIRNENREGLLNCMTEANEIRDILDGKFKEIKEERR